MRPIIFFLLIITVSVLSAADIFLNDVKVSGRVTDQELKNCTVKFDEKGNIHITAPGVKIVEENKAGQTQPDTKKYFVNIASSPSPSAGPIKLYVNGKEIDSLKQGSANALIEITLALKKGDNQISVMAPPEGVKTTCQIVIGTGKINSGSIELTPLTDVSESYSDKGLSKTLNFKVE